MVQPRMPVRTAAFILFGGGVAAQQNCGFARYLVTGFTGTSDTINRRSIEGLLRVASRGGNTTMQREET